MLFLTEGEFKAVLQDGNQETAWPFAAGTLSDRRRSLIFSIALHQFWGSAFAQSRTSFGSSSQTSGNRFGTADRVRDGTARRSNLKDPIYADWTACSAGPPSRESLSRNAAVLAERLRAD